MKIRIKYFEDAKKMKKISKGNWIDVYAYQDIFIPENSEKKIPLGFALELPAGWEAHLAPRSSTFKNWNIIQTNGVGVIDDTFKGDNDMWCMPVFCIKGQEYKYTEDQVRKIIGDKYQKEQIEEGIKYSIVSNDECKINDIITNTVTTKSLINKKGIWVHKGDKVAQFRIMESMPEIEFEEVEHLLNEDRGGFGTTGKK